MERDILDIFENRKEDVPWLESGSWDERVWQRFI